MEMKNTLKEAKDKVKNKFSDWQNGGVFPRLFLRFFASWSCVSVVFALANGQAYLEKEFFEGTSTLLFVLFVMAFFLMLTILSNSTKKHSISVDAIFCGIGVLLYGFILLWRSTEFYFLISVLILLCFVGYYLLRNDKPLGLTRLKVSNKALKITVIVCLLFTGLYIGVLTCLKQLNMGSPNFDDGIFAQMFYYMKTTGLPLTTCERDGLLSHFAVHTSPIFYLLLPGYFIFSSPLYLQVMQAVIIASGVIPVYLIAKNKGLSNKVILCICVAYSFFPANIGGAFYSFHENAFLTPLLLWFFYFYEKRKFLFMYIFAVLVFFVKEDAAIYIGVIALYMIVSRREFKHGGILLVSAIVYFLTVLKLMDVFGLGSMDYRYENFLTNVSEDSLFMIIVNVFKNPGYLLTQILSLEKLQFLVYMLLPLGFLPFASRKYTRLVLLIPMLLVNLMSSYGYQHDIGFQYTFGVTGILFYLSLINLADMKGRFKKYLTSLAAAGSAFVFAFSMSGKLDYIDRYNNGKDNIERIYSVMEKIPDDASVITSTYFVVPLSQRDIIYEDYYHENGEETEYVLVDTRSSRSTEFVDKYEALGYTIIEQVPGAATLLHKDVG